VAGIVFDRRHPDFLHKKIVFRKVVLSDLTLEAVASSRSLQVTSDRFPGSYGVIHRGWSFSSHEYPIPQLRSGAYSRSRINGRAIGGPKVQSTNNENQSKQET
jgi:hypothetical protein